MLISGSRPEDLVGCLIQILLHEGESGRCPLFPPARVLKVIQGEYGNPDFVVEFVRPVTVTTPNDEEEARFEGLRIVVLRPHAPSDRLERLFKMFPNPVCFSVDMYQFREGVDPHALRGPSRRGIELKQWGLGAGEVRLYRVGKKFRPKFIDDSRWLKRLNRMRAGEI